VSRLVRAAAHWVSALRERADRDELVRSAFVRAATEANCVGLTLTDTVVRVLARYSWLGNMRELQHVAQFAVAASDSALIDLQALPPLFMNVGTETSTKTASDKALRRSATDSSAISEALRRTAWNVSGAAALLGISRATLHRRLIQFNLRRPGALEDRCD
jgi:transcriptional regulator of acetoin/glycerol metabolism